MRAVGTQNAWFSFKGVRNDSLDVRMISMPSRPHPARKGELIDVPGVDGKLWIDEGAYDRILVTIRVLTGDNGNIDAISAWLSGEGDLIFGDEPERVYHARITKEYTRTNQNARLRGQAFTITFDCEPFRYEANPAGTFTVSESPSEIFNPGSIPSMPLIRVNCIGAGNVLIGNETMLFENLTGYVVIDCAAKVAYTGTGAADDPMLLATQNVTGEWLTIAPGKQYISFTGNITSVEILPRWRWL